MKRHLLWLFYKIFKVSRKFTFQGRSYDYFYHHYNNTWQNERAVEVPIIWEVVRSFQGRRILELGNVLSHYFPVTHDVVDRFEIQPGVINQDIINFQPARGYDLIVCISTLEHIGWDARPQQPQKCLQVIEKLKQCLGPGGKIMISVPLGYNYHLDRLLENGGIKFSQRYCLKRISRDNQWQQVGWHQINKAQYGTPFPNANGLLIGWLNTQ